MSDRMMPNDSLPVPPGEGGETTTVCPSCGGASLYVGEAYGDCERCGGTGDVEPYPVRRASSAEGSGAEPVGRFFRYGCAECGVGGGCRGHEVSVDPAASPRLDVRTLTDDERSAVVLPAWLLASSSELTDSSPDALIANDMQREAQSAVRALLGEIDRLRAASPCGAGEEDERGDARRGGRDGNV